MECASCDSENPPGSPKRSSCGEPFEAPEGELVALQDEAPVDGPSSSPDDPSTEMPGCVTAYVALMFIGLVFVIARTFLPQNSPLYSGPLGPIAIAAIIVHALTLVGLWRVKNWARIVVILLSLLNLLGVALAALRGGLRGIDSSSIVSNVFIIALSLWVVYWFATHRELFR